MDEYLPHPSNCECLQCDYESRRELEYLRKLSEWERSPDWMETNPY